ncbi:MAG: YgiQ family radical SAM protein [Lachnospiraceae bacterium]|nr:YgiQ family radical SAM protein [Lachnospiraceae bacterium]
MPFLPTTKEEMKQLHIQQLDFVYVIGDAYVDHSSFGPAVISRVLESRGYTVGIIAQPDWKNDASIAVLGEPRLAFLVSAGNMDSMVNHFTVAKKRRSVDNYSPGGKMGLRPDRAVTVYGNLIRRTFKNTPMIIGGIEASLRRLGHYDYWSDKVRRSVLLDSGADLISYGMGEKSIVEIADALAAGIPVEELTYIRGTVFKSRELPEDPDLILLPDFEDISSDKDQYGKSFRIQYENTDPFNGKRLAEGYGTRGYCIQNPPAEPLTEQELDDVYELPYMRAWHPSYDAQGGIPAFSEIRFSLTSNRGCFGSCNFCALTFHEGRIVQARSEESLVREAKELVKDPLFKGNIHDVGGPTADFTAPACSKQMTKGACSHRQCLFPERCKNCKVDHKKYVSILRSLRAIPGVKRVFIRSGIRFDYVADEKDPTFMRELVEHHISGQLRVAPEHVSEHVLRMMGKPSHQVYERFLKKFDDANKKAGKDQYCLPYFMSSHPGSSLEDAIRLAEYIRDMGFIPEQAQDFYPTPSTISTCMFYTGKHPVTGEKVHVPKGVKEKAMQRALIQYRVPENYDLVKEALLLCHREDLIGFGPKCLIRPRKPQEKNAYSGTAGRAGKHTRPGRTGGGKSGKPGNNGKSGKAGGSGSNAGRSGASKSGKNLKHRGR